MLLISHRGNRFGRMENQENQPNYVSETLKAFDVEIDVWKIDNKWYLGHDKPQYEIDKSFLAQEINTHRFWCHCKNLDAAVDLFSDQSYISFFHQTDDCTLTSNGWVWTFPKKPILSEKQIAVMPPFLDNSWKKAGGVCADCIQMFVPSGVIDDDFV